jgi:tetraacyldisaccharide 4'-kinase
VYGLVTGLRNLLYDKSIIKSYQPRIPVIVVGNLIAGGTGKTPTIAWLAKSLSEKQHVAILSRGYGRRTRGFLLLDQHATPDTVGDEPMELRLLLPGIPIAVDGNRKRGIEKLASEKYGQVDLILMDDGFQHRRVKPGYAIVLDDFNRPMHREKLLPAGLRRESLSGLKRADQVIITKKRFSLHLDPVPGPVILITGIANPMPLAAEISKKNTLYIHLKYSDHHRYTTADAASVRRLYHSLIPESRDGENAAMPVLLTTGKDYVKLARFPELADLPLQWIPVGPPVDPEEESEILKKIEQYVEKANGNR